MLLEEIGAECSSDKEYDGESLITLRNFIFDYTVYHEQSAEGMTEKGNDLINIASYIDFAGYLARLE